MQQTVAKQVWKDINVGSLDFHQTKSIIRSSVFLKEMFFPNGQFDKLKARLVAGGDQMDRSLYGKVSSPAVSLESVFISAVLAALEGRHISTMDISGAFLNADMSGEMVYDRLDKRVPTFLLEFDPEGAAFINPDGTIAVQLLKGMCGRIQCSLL